MLGLPSTLGWRIIAISRKFTASSHRFARPLLKDSILMDESLHLLVSLSNQRIPNSCPTLPQALARLRNRSLSKGLQTWLVAHNRRQHVLRVCDKAVRGMVNLVAHRSFNSWVVVFNRRRRLARVCDRALRQLMHLVVSRSLRAWSLVCRAR